MIFILSLFVEALACIGMVLLTFILLYRMMRKRIKLDRQLDYVSRIVSVFLMLLLSMLFLFGLLLWWSFCLFLAIRFIEWVLKFL